MTHKIALVAVVVLAAVSMSPAWAQTAGLAREIACNTINGPGLACQGTIDMQQGLPLRIDACAVKFRQTDTEYRYGTSIVISNLAARPIANARIDVFGRLDGADVSIGVFTFAGLPQAHQTYYSTQAANYRTISAPDAAPTGGFHCRVTQVALAPPVIVRSPPPHAAGAHWAAFTMDTIGYRAESDLIRSLRHDRLLPPKGSPKVWGQHERVEIVRLIPSAEWGPREHALILQITKDEDLGMIPPITAEALNHPRYSKNSGFLAIVRDKSGDGEWYVDGGELFVPCAGGGLASGVNRPLQPMCAEQGYWP